MSKQDTTVKKRKTNIRPDFVLNFRFYLFDFRKNRNNYFIFLYKNIVISFVSVKL